MRYIFRGLINSESWGTDQVIPDDGTWVFGDLQLHGDMTWVNGRLVDPRTIGAYTGIRDRRNQRMFEGDIVLIDGDGGAIAKIAWHDYLCQFYLCFSHEDKPAKDDTKASLGEMIFQYRHSFEVIGNVYENPDLLPQKNPYLVAKGS